MFTADMLYRQLDRMGVEFNCTECAMKVQAVVTQRSQNMMTIRCERDYGHVIAVATQRDASDILARVRAGNWKGTL